jgi:triacylglycerol esterase/lipase EstA (alpha/beta hydrolase family)
MARNPLMFIHGYGDQGTVFTPWLDQLRAMGFEAEAMHVCSYLPRSNVLTIEDIAEAFDRALHEQLKLSPEQEIDIVVHSAGMLVARARLALRADRRMWLKHLIGLAPATYGSPMASKRRGTLGMIFGGNRELGPDFLETGERILDSLEPGSRFTWDLAHREILGPIPPHSRSTLGE